MSDFEEAGVEEAEALTPKYTVEEVEQIALKYYTTTYPTEDSSGKYVVLHNETTESDGLCHILIRIQQEMHISDPVADVYINLFTGDCKVSSRAISESKPAAPVSGNNKAGIWLTIAALVLWLFAPFMAVYLYQFDDQPAALQILLDDPSFSKELDQSWVALGVGLCIIICLISLCRKAGGTARVFSLTGFGIMCAIFLKFVDYASGNGDFLAHIFGVGFWAIFVLLFLIFCVSKKQKE